MYFFGGAQLGRPSPSSKKLSGTPTGMVAQWCSITRSTMLYSFASSALMLSQRPRFLANSPRAAHPVEIDPAVAPLFQRRVTLMLEETTVAKALAEVARQAKIHVVYSRDVIDSDAAVRINVDRITVAAALTELLLGRGVDIVLSGKNNVTLAPRRLPARSAVVTGRVTDAKTGEGIEGARWTWRIPGGARPPIQTGGIGWRTWTAGSYTLTVRRLGYAKQSRAVTVADGRADTVDVALEPVRDAARRAGHHGDRPAAAARARQRHHAAQGRLDRADPADQQRDRPAGGPGARARGAADLGGAGRSGAAAAPGRVESAAEQRSDRGGRRRAGLRRAVGRAEREPG